MLCILPATLQDHSIYDHGFSENKKVDKYVYALLSNCYQSLGLYTSHIHTLLTFLSLLCSVVISLHQMGSTHHHSLGVALYKLSKRTTIYVGRSSSSHSCRQNRWLTSSGRVSWTGC